MQNSMTTAASRSTSNALNAMNHPENRPQHRASDSVSAATLLEWLRSMLLIREFENRCGQSYQQAKIGGFCHLYRPKAAAVAPSRACTVTTRS
jgi:pyruvate dehydrogenase E1 component alpha subunit